MARHQGPMGFGVYDSLTRKLIDVASTLEKAKRMAGWHRKGLMITYIRKTRRGK